MVNQVSQTLAVPGAHLRYHVQGSGPVLLLIPGGPADSSNYATLTPLLTDTYTVVTYDPRALGESTVDDSSAKITVETQADDVFHLLSAVDTVGQARVFANSGGALTALSLLVRRPEAVSALVAHEPPVSYLLPDAETIAQQDKQLETIYRQQGVLPAMMQFLSNIGLGDDAGGEPEPEHAEAAEDPASMDRLMAQFDVFFDRMIGPLSEFRADLTALRSSHSRIMVAGGATSHGELAQRSASALAEQLGLPLKELPGGHNGFNETPEAFASALRALLIEPAV